MKNAVIPVFFSALCLLAAACADNKEKNDLALGQACLDQVPESNPIQALQCMQYADQYSDQQALIEQCSILLTAGGLTTTRITQAYNAAQSQSGSGGNNQGAAYVAYLAFTTYSNPTDGLNRSPTGTADLRPNGLGGPQHFCRYCCHRVTCELARRRKRN